jgi:nicotinamidase-related amidase
MFQSKDITSIAFGGFRTNCCVESTMRSGYENGYQAITLNGCVTASSVEGHENAPTYGYPMFSQPMNSAEFIEEFEGPCIRAPGPKSSTCSRG